MAEISLLFTRVRFKWLCKWKSHSPFNFRTCSNSTKRSGRLCVWNTMCRDRICTLSPIFHAFLYLENWHWHIECSGLCRAAARGSRCMDSAVACHFGDNWSVLQGCWLTACRVAYQRQVYTHIGILLFIFWRVRYFTFYYKFRSLLFIGSQFRNNRHLFDLVGERKWWFQDIANALSRGHSSSLLLYIVWIHVFRCHLMNWGLCKRLREPM